MSYQTYQKSFVSAGKAIGAAAVLLMLAACGDAGSESGNIVDAQDLLAADQTVEGKAGTWGDITYGDKDAPVTVIEYASMTCPHCANFSTNIFPKVKKKFIDTGKIRFIFRNYVMNGTDMTAAIVARCRDEATAQRLIKVFYSRQREWSGAQDRNAALASLVRRNANMSRSEFDRCASNREMMTGLTEMTKRATGFKVVATPTVFVDGVAIDNFLWDNLEKVLDEATSK